jgi:hypothetical protein
VNAFFFIIMGTKPVIRRGGEIVKRHCPNCGDWRNFQETTWQNFFSVFFIPLFPLGAPRIAYTCVTCGLPLSREAAAGPGPVQEEGPPFPAGETLIVQCPRCDGRMRIPLRERGFIAVCPHCTLEFRVKGQREAVPEAGIRDN